MPTLVGRLDGRGQPIVDIQIAGARDTITALIDTGYDGELFCYNDLLDAVGAQTRFTSVDHLRLADGTEVLLLVTSAVLDWLGRPRTVDIDVVATPAPLGARCLVGCRLLSDTRLEIDFPRGDVRISRD